MSLIQSCPAVQARDGPLSWRRLTERPQGCLVVLEAQGLGSLKGAGEECGGEQSPGWAEGPAPRLWPWFWGRHLVLSRVCVRMRV